MSEVLTHQHNTLKKRRLLKALAGSETLREASIKAGYKANSRYIYEKQTKAYIEQNLQAMGYTEEGIKKEFERLSALAESNKDFSNAMRGKENIARICGYFKDKQEITNKQEVSPVTPPEELKNRLTKVLNTLNTKDKQ